MRFFILGLLCTAMVGCLKNEPLTNDSDVSEKMSMIQNELSQATRGLNPNSMQVGEWALFQYYARLYTSPYQRTGYSAHQVLKKNYDTVDVDGTLIDIAKIDVLETNYNEPENPDDTPPISLQREWNCQFALPPYSMWANDCDLPPYQNFLLFYPLQTDDNLRYFYNFKKTFERVKLPRALVDENRCYNFTNCEYEATIIEFDLITYENGERKRLHVKNTFNNQLPYLASNPKQCISTLVEVGNQMHPYEICRELVNFKYGE